MKNQPDYRFSEHVNVPDGWVERALSIPSAAQKEPRRFSGRSRRAAAAAGVVLALGLSISLYFVFRNIDDSSAVAPSAAPTGSAPTLAPSLPTDAALTDAASAPPTQPASASVSTSGASERPTEPASAAPSAAPPIDPADASAAVPTDRPTQPQTEPVPPPTEPPFTPTEKPTHGAEPSAESDIVIFIPLDFETIQTAEDNSEEPLFCRIYRSTGVLIGDSDLFAPSHRAYLLETNDGPRLYYEQPLPETGYAAADCEEYEYVVYDGKGRTLIRGIVKP